jgi:hypothetical protein
MLISRISTDTQEKISRIEVHFRNYKSSESLVRNKGIKKQEPSLEELWLLDRTKARLAYFLRSIKEQNPSFIFDVHAAQGNWEIEDDEDLEAFLDELAGLSFMPSVNEAVTNIAQKTGEVYIFSTACDIGLSAFLLTCNPRPVTLFISQPPEKEQKSKDFKSLDLKSQTPCEKEILRLSDFYSKGCNTPAHWLVLNKVKPLSVNTNRMEINYAGVKL